MPGFNSYIGLSAVSQKLLAAMRANAEGLEVAEPVRAQVEQAFTELRTLLARRDTLAADKQVLTRQTREVADRLNELNIDLKTIVKGALGSRSEKLTEFLISPRRKVLRTDRPRARRAPAGEPATEARPETTSASV